jgi:hypothetical protein
MDEEGGGDLEITEKYESDGSTDQVIQESNSQTSEGVSIFESKKKKESSHSSLPLLLDRGSW